MRVIRSFPEAPPPGRGYVQDGLERFCNSNYDYTGLKQYGDDIVLLEWDTAVSTADLARFTRSVTGSYWPAVAPYLSRDSAHYMHWRCEKDGPRPITKGEQDCDLFGFGMVYLPGWALRDYPPGFGNSSNLGDGSFPRWLMTRPEWQPVAVDWSITVVHLGP